MTSFFAIIDLGSNAVRMSINALCENGQWKNVENVRSTVRLAEGMSSDNCLKKDAMDRVIEAVKEFNKKAKEYNCQSVAAIATAALRNAANREQFLKRMSEEAGMDFEVISGEDEAYYSYMAVKNTIGITDGVIFDTGGGSTEIILVKKGELIKSTSLPLGAVVLTEKMASMSEMKIYRYVASSISTISWIEECDGVPLYGIGGSARTLAMLYKEKILKYNEIDGVKIPYHEVSRIYHNVFKTPSEMRKGIKGMDVNRADIIFAGLTPAKALMDITGSGCIHVCSAGVKEGVFYNMVNSTKSAQMDEVRSKKK